MTKHPGKTEAQRRVLDEIGCGEHCPRMSNATRDVLLRDGLIERLSDKRVGTDRFGPILIPQYQMTVATHIAWCEAVPDE